MPSKKQAPAHAGDTGSPAGEPFYLTVGFLRRPHGVRGEMIMDLHTDFPERLKANRKIYIGEKHKACVLEGARPHGDKVLVKLRGIDTPEDAGQYRNQWVYVKTSEVPELPAGKVYQHQLLGMTVLDENEQALGRLEEILETGANDVYVVRDDSGRELLLPAIDSVILAIDPARRVMRVHLLEGL